METLFGSIAVVTGIGAIGYAWLLHKQVQATAGWPTARGEILEARMERESSSQLNNRSATFAPKIRYRYEVNGRSFTSNTIMPGGTLDTSSRERAEERLRRWPAGTVVPVFYNPRRPHQSCLERHAEGIGFTVAVGAFMIAFGLGFAGGYIG